MTTSQRFTVWRLAVAQTVVWAGTYYLFPALLPYWERDLGWSKTELTGAFSAALVVSALTAPAAGRLIDRGHGRRLLALSMLSAALLLLALAAAERLWQFYLLWLLLGVTMAGALYEACFAFLTVLLAERARAAITRVTLVAGFAGSLAFPGAHLLADAFGWRGAAVGFAMLIALIAAPLTWFCDDATPRPRPPRSDPARPATAAAAVLRSPLFWLPATAFACIMLNHGMLIVHLLPLLAERGVDAALAVLAAGLIGPMQVGGRLLLLLSAERLSAVGAAALSFITLAAAATALAVAGDAPWLILAFVVLQGGGYGITSVVRPLITAEFLGRDGFGTVSGMMAVPFVGAMAAAPTLAALLWRGGGYDAVLAVCLLCALFGLCCLVAAARYRRAPTTEDDHA